MSRCPSPRCECLRGPPGPGRPPCQPSPLRTGLAAGRSCGSPAGPKGSRVISRCSLNNDAIALRPARPRRDLNLPDRMRQRHWHWRGCQVGGVDPQRPNRDRNANLSAHDDDRHDDSNSNSNSASDTAAAGEPRVNQSRRRRTVLLDAPMHPELPQRQRFRRPVRRRGMEPFRRPVRRVL